MTSLATIQILAILFGLLMFYLTFLHYKRKEFNKFQFVIWESLWVGFVAIALLPERFAQFNEELGTARAFDLFAIIAFVVVLFLTFHNYLLITKLEKHVETRVRNNALDALPPKETSKTLNDPS